MSSLLKPGTQTKDALLYTAEQVAALDGMVDPAYSLRIARGEFANTVLAPDGSHIDEIKPMLDAIKSRSAAAAERGVAASSATAESEEEDAANAELAKAAFDEAARLSQLSKEVKAHAAEGRFLFVVDENFTPLIYYQCVVDGNPDLPPLVEAE